MFRGISFRSLASRALARCPFRLILLTFLALSVGCGRQWEVPGSSFPTESSTGRSVSQPVEEKEAPSPPPTASPQGEREPDDVSRRAEELRLQAERLAQHPEGDRAELAGSEERSGPSRGVQELKAEPELPAGTSGRTRPIPDLQDIFFDFDQSLLREEARAILQKNAAWLRSHPEAEIVIEGHCDERGTVEYNLALGERRAQSAKDYLADLGVASERVSIISYGKEKPFALGHDEGAWAQNRRAHFLLRTP